MNNLLSYFGLVDTRIRASDKDLPVQKLLTAEVVLILDTHIAKKMKKLLQLTV